MELLTEMIALFKRWIEYKNTPEWDNDDNDETMADLGLEEAIIVALELDTIGEVRQCAQIADCPELRRVALYYMIKRDAERHYNDIDGFLDAIISHEYPEELLADPKNDHFNGLAICQWMDLYHPDPANPPETTENTEEKTLQ